MKQIIQMLADTVLKKAYGKKQYQSFFGFLHSIGVKGMNLRYNALNEDGEVWVLTMVSSYYKKKGGESIVFDVGANIGDYSKKVLDVFSKVELYSFEPSKKTYKLLEKNIGSTPHTSLFNFGFSDKHERVQLFFNSHDHSTSSMYHAGPILENDRFELEEIEVKRLDDFCSMNGIPKIHFLKIDVEGNEVKVLEGAKHMLENNSIDFIQFEFGPKNVDSRTFLKDFYVLLEPNYKIYRILRNGLRALMPYHQDYEAFFHGNYLAVSNKIDLM